MASQGQYFLHPSSPEPAALSTPLAGITERRAALVDFVMGTNGEQQDCKASLLPDEVEYDSQIVRHTAGKRFAKSPFQLVRLQAGMKRILCQKPKGNLEVITDPRASLDEVLGVSLESSGVDERITHSAILFASSLGVTISESPEEYCLRASSTAAISSDLRASDTRRRTISSRASCSSWESRSTASITSANVNVASTTIHRRVAHSTCQGAGEPGEPCWRLTSQRRPSACGANRSHSRGLQPLVRHAARRSACHGPGAKVRSLTTVRIRRALGGYPKERSLS